MIRGDGNFKLAKRVCVPVWGRRFHARPFTVVLAWTGTDGSLLKPVALKRGETLKCIVEDLAPLLDSIKAARLAAGLPPEACAPVFHATDNFRSQRKRLRELYRQKWPELHTRVLARTPLGDAAGSADVGACPTEITGDPRHDVIALRKLVPPTCNDWRDFIADHTDALNRLSAPLPPAPTLGALPPPPAQEARRLVHFGVEQPADAFRREISLRPQAARELRELLGSAGALQSPVWNDEFQALPPRGALERLATRLGAALHRDNGFHNFVDQSAFKKEIRRLKKWYKPGRRLTRAQRGWSGARRRQRWYGECAACSTRRSRHTIDGCCRAPGWKACSPGATPPWPFGPRGSRSRAAPFRSSASGAVSSTCSQTRPGT